MAVIGNRIRQVLRILHTDGPCTAREVFDRMDGAINDLAEASKYLYRARNLGLATCTSDRPALHTITDAGVTLISSARIAGVHEIPKRSVPRGPASVFDLARTL